MGTLVTLKASVTVQPAGLSYTLVGTDPDDLIGRCMSFTSGTESGSGTVLLSAARPLPDSICNFSAYVNWGITISGWDIGSIVAASSNTVYVTYATPFTTWSYDTPAGGGKENIVTDQRLALATLVCSGSTTVFQAAAAIQTYLASHVPWADTPGDLAWNDESQVWGMLDTGGKKGWCCQASQLHELILGQLGIHATSELILPTLPNGPKGQMRLFTAADIGKFDPNIPPQESFPSNLTPSGWLVEYLYFYFNQKTAFEGGVRVQDPANPSVVEFFSEGRKPSERVVGTTNDLGSAEYNAIVQIAMNFSPDGKSANHLQRWGYAGRKDGKVDFFWASYDNLPKNLKQ